MFCSHLFPSAMQTSFHGWVWFYNRKKKSATVRVSCLQLPRAGQSAQAFMA